MAKHLKLFYVWHDHCDSCSMLAHTHVYDNQLLFKSSIFKRKKFVVFFASLFMLQINFHDSQKCKQ